MAIEKIVNLPTESDFIINQCMYELQGKKITLEKINDPDYDYIDNLIYIYNDDLTVTIKERTQKLFNKLVKDKTVFVDCSMWRDEWLKDKI